MTGPEKIISFLLKIIIEILVIALNTAKENISSKHDADEVMVGNLRLAWENKETAGIYLTI